MGALSGLGLSLTLILTLVSGCASSRMSDSEADRLFRQGHYDEAAAHLKKGLEKEGEEGKDRLLYLFDLGLSLHLASRYAESNKVFLEAENIADIRDYTSLGNEAATLLVTDNIKSYKGEDFEKVLVNVFLALNYTLLGDAESALVEARKVNRKLYLMVSEGKRKYKQNAFARYLSAILFESQGEYNDAYVDYKKTRELLPGLPGLGRDLWRIAQLLNMPDQMEEWESTYHLTEDDKRIAKQRGGKSKKGEIIVVFQNGISPIKRPHENLASIPKFVPRANPVKTARVALDGVEVGQPIVLHDVESTAIENLDEKYAGIIAKKIAGAATKLIVANQIEKQTNSGALGALSRVLLFAADQADLRSWNLLPKDLQILRVPADAGIHTVVLTPIGGGSPLEKTVQVSAGKKLFVNFRYIP